MGMMTEPASGIWREDLIENQVRNAQYLTIFGGHYRREIKMEVGFMCLYQCMIYVFEKKQKNMSDLLIIIELE